MTSSVLPPAPRVATDCVVEYVTVSVNEIDVDRCVSDSANGD
jgi:hypothetical protein